MSRRIPLSPAELVMNLIKNKTTRDDVPHVVVGPLSGQQQQEGGVTLTDSGQGRVELYLPLLRPRIQMRCIAPTLSDAEAIARTVYDAIHGTTREVVVQESTGDTYLIHFLNVNGGPSAHLDTDETWEGLLFAEGMIGTSPVARSS